MIDSELRHARWFAGGAGFLSAISFPVVLFFCCVAARLLSATLRHHVGGRPMPALTEWILTPANRLPSSLSAWLVIASDTFLFAYLPLLIAVCRTRSVAAVALTFALWIGLLLTVEMLTVSFVAFTLILPFAPSTGKLQSSSTTLPDATKQTIAEANFHPVGRSPFSTS